jgi:hypothetical protein
MDEETIRKEIESLPSGGLTVRTVKGRKYIYHQWTENGRQRSRTVSEDEAEELRAEIGRRKELEKELKGGVKNPSQASPFRTSVITGERLMRLASSVSTYRKREIFSNLEKYVRGDSHDTVCILYGLRRTGKTTLMRQMILSLSPEDRAKTALIQIRTEDNLGVLNRDLIELDERGYRYIFIDEVTLMSDFIGGAALFSDIYAAEGMKIVLSGTDSLGFLLSRDEQLYGRCILLHTTFIPYREFRNVLGLGDVDTFLRYGGTMCPGGTDYNSGAFSSAGGADEYVNTAIAVNIQHSLENYQGGGHFRRLLELYRNGELTGAVNRIVEDMNHDFTVDVLTRDFRSGDFELAKANVRRDRKETSTVLDDVDEKKLTGTLKGILEILDRDRQKTQVKQSHADEIREYLFLLDLIDEIPLVNMTSLNERKVITVFSQCGLRYARAEALISSLLLDERFSSLSHDERARIEERILDTIRGRMLEELVLLETKKALGDRKVFKLQFAVGEFDMVVQNGKEGTIDVFEIKHSKERNEMQYRHIMNEENAEKAAFRFGRIKRRIVLYRGENCTLDNGVEYINVEEYLMSLGSESEEGR